ncbi:hypothetical protein [Thermus amyloliquefaciens]|uniref:hypothetical protein n=1 Tax=Thermus amyloliquefaciens TaxID=1449080 RepID=UPI00056DED15|nr:hypothetical protein [Thermus amyloliquefaciens]
MKVRLPLYGPARAEGPLGPLPLRRKALAILYYLALEGPTRREKLADLLWGHGAALQNLRVELTHLRRVFGQGTFQGRVLELPPGVELDRTPGGEEVLEGLEDLSPSFDDWLHLQRARLGVPEDPLSLPERLQGVRPPALVVLIGPPGSGRRALARKLAETLGLPFHEGLGQGAGVFYLADPLPPQEEALRLKPSRGQVLVVARSLFGEDPAFLLALRARFPAEITRVLRVPRLEFSEARRLFLRNLPFMEAARYYLASGGRPEVLQELLAMRDPSALPQRVRAMVALEARHLSLEGRRALEILSLHPGAFPYALAEGLGLAQHLDELENRGWLVFAEGRYRFREPQFRPYLAAQRSLGECLRCHQRMAEVFRGLKDPVAEAYHRSRAGEPVEIQALAKALKEWRKVVADPGFPWSDFPPQTLLLGLGPSLPLEVPEPLTLVSLDGEPVEVPLVLQEPAVVRLSGQVYQELPLGLGVDAQAFPLRLLGEGRGVFFLPTEARAGLFWGAVLPQAPLDHLFLLPPGVYRLGLGTRGLAELYLQAHRPVPGALRVLAPLGQAVEV